MSRTTDVVRVTQQWSELRQRDRAAKNDGTKRRGGRVQAEMMSGGESTPMPLEPVRKKEAEIKWDPGGAGLTFTEPISLQASTRSRKEKNERQK